MQQPGPATSNEGRRVIAYLRFPFPRDTFQDPVPVDWDASKQQQLWDRLSHAPNRADVAWDALSQQFNVSVPFILQQAAWLYERELKQVRAQMHKVSRLRPPGTASSTSVQRPPMPLGQVSASNASTFTIKPTQGSPVHAQTSSFSGRHVSSSPGQSPSREWSQGPTNLSSGEGSSGSGSFGHNSASRKLLSMSRTLPRRTEPTPFTSVRRGAVLDSDDETADSVEDDVEGFLPVQLDPATRPAPHNAKWLSNASSSSITDLSETSVTKSALEEALNDFSEEA